MSYKRKKMSKKKSRNKFQKGAAKVHPKNVKKSTFRGGYRL